MFQAAKFSYVPEEDEEEHEDPLKTYWLLPLSPILEHTTTRKMAFLQKPVPATSPCQIQE